MNKVIRIALADTSADKLFQLRKTLSAVTSYRIIIEALNGKDLIQKLNRTHADIMLINFKMPVISDLNKLSNLKEQFPDLRIVLMALYNDPLLLWNYMSTGVNGMILQHFGARQICQTIDGVLQKGYFCSEAILKSISRAKTKPISIGPDEVHIRFSKIELQVIKCICQEMTSQQIAEKLFISKRTIDWYRREIMKRIGVKTSIGIVKYAISNGLFDCDQKK